MKLNQFIQSFDLLLCAGNNVDVVAAFAYDSLK